MYRDVRCIEPLKSSSRNADLATLAAIFPGKPLLGVYLVRDAKVLRPTDGGILSRHLVARVHVPCNELFPLAKQAAAHAPWEREPYGVLVGLAASPGY